MDGTGTNWDLRKMYQNVQVSDKKASYAILIPALGEKNK